MNEKFKIFVTEKHNQPSGSQRYGSAPYSKHLQDVVDVMKEYEYYLKDEDKEDVEHACLGHDLIEDTEVSVRDIVQWTNERISRIIFNVSNERGLNRKEKNFKTYPKIWGCDFSIFVKLCDRIANTRNSKKSFETNSNGDSLFQMYKKEYPIFKYALKVRGLYPDMWKELDNLYYK